jgi:hypothetical protein
MSDSLTKYWMGDGVEEITQDSLIKLASHRRAVANMVRIVTGKNIPVKFNVIDKSFMTAGMVVISSKVEGKNYDVNIGLALHEGTHVAEDSLRVMGDIPLFISAQQRARVTNLKIDLAKWFKFVTTIYNIVEDRRIDEKQQRQSPGYKGYYDAMYERYFFHPNLKAAFADPNYKTSENLESYKARIINLVDEESNLDVLKGLLEIS